MTEEELKKHIQQNYPKEGEAVEWKAWTGNFNIDGKPKDDMGSYVSAISNENGGFLVIGVENKTLEILGISIKKSKKDVELEILRKTYPEIKIKIIEYTVSDTNKKIWIVEIPKHPLGQFVSFHKPYQRSDDSLIELTQSRKEEIASETKRNYDWSAQPCESATIDDLDEEAVQMAKEGYIKKQFSNEPERAEEIRKFGTMRFLEEALMLTKDRELTNAALLILGNKKARTKLGCGFATEIAWLERAYGVDEDFVIPFQKSIYDLVDKITIKKLEFQTKITGEYTGNNYFKDNYNKENLRECIANCIAHQDYSKHERIVVYEDIHKQIIFENAGASLHTKEEFEKIRLRKMMPTKYRNKFLANTMREIGLMEAKGTGHNKMYKYNTEEVYLPLPEIDWNNKEKFVLTIYGANLDENFARILQEKSDLEPTEILLLDQIQKGHRVLLKDFNKLKNKGLVIGTPTKARLSLEVAETANLQKEEDEKDQVFNFRPTFESLILTPMKSHKNGMHKQEMVEYIHQHLPYTKDFNRNKLISDIGNSLTKMKKNGIIEPIGDNPREIKWKLRDKN